MQTYRERIIGAWRLASYTIEEPDGEVRAPLGPNADGFIIYSPDGYMSAQMMAQGRPAYASDDWLIGSDEELRAAAGGYLAYSGPFSVDEEKGTLQHHVTVSLFPNWIGDAQVRRIKLEGDLLSLSPVNEPGERIQTIVWRRAPQH
ncbi:lipocalin-like domain-containing protein [Actinacidiphila guanduensis]|uniref:Lipocalin-like domain-containing protein n=1 Tax=Actinacidiphila guanduensis TaxID=310781 RepID=A0A1H0S0G8_9ACTN|nr:lipocalin-like domain-containing protein [Actinacidiphila guanduensis]SDP35312.1 Lipocalin-like domain-containing protein [Actinacidiphila guanduensis]